MEYNASTLLPLLPEIVLLSAIAAILILDLFLDQAKRFFTYGLSIAALVATIAAVMASGGEHSQTLMYGAYVRDAMSDVLKISLLSVGIFAFIYSRAYLVERGLFRGEFYTLGMLAILGMMIMVSAGGFLSLYLGLELLALSLYALVAFDGKSKAGSEAAMKYFVLGALASGMLLYGISMIYGGTGMLDFAGVAKAIASGETDKTVLTFGLVFVLIGIAFKFGAVPFHMWAPDVYQGAPVVVTAFLGSVPKIAAFAMAMRILSQGLGGLGPEVGWQGWQGMLIILAVLSVALGNVVAVVQDNIKRMLAYSTISHVGFIFMGLLAGAGKGYTSAMFYTIVYALTAVGAFGLLAILSRKGVEAENIHDLKGLNKRSPWLAAMMMLMMFSMAGVPPTVGFFAKLFVLDALVNANMLWLALVAVAFSVIGAFYYLRVVKAMYFDMPISQAPIVAGADARIAISVNGLAMLYYGIFPASLLTLCQAAIQSL
ncbi:NADH-quinone oxidoreductase subunit NuoN [Thiolapillus brandeum]|uniref:NADH-quinone oxidoreductase subunit NuoN n=1 Tax=Thiolapillus brandeum TaxID=1076588 RepID=UPI000597261B|nr:NADH-quinone oxidoreductase subunit NuoN [Thiolapillus brandeum]